MKLEGITHNMRSNLRLNVVIKSYMLHHDVVTLSQALCNADVEDLFERTQQKGEKIKFY